MARSRSGTVMSGEGGNPFAALRDEASQGLLVGSQHTLRTLGRSSGGDSDDDDSQVANTSTRHRSDTFGGVPIPPMRVTPASPLLSDNEEADVVDAKTCNRSSSPYGGPTTATATSTATLRRPSITRSRSSSLTSLHLGGGGWFAKRPLLTAALQAFALFLVSLLTAWLALRILLPPFDPKDWDRVKVPKSFDDLKELNAVLQSYKERGYFRIMACFAIVYLFIQAFSIPGSMYLSMLAGALYGVLVALPLVCFCVATGALLSYALSALVGGAFLSSPKWTRRLLKWNDRIDAHRSDLIPYLIVLRIAPLPPHWVVNMIAPHLNISPWTFWLSTFLGIAGVSYIHTQIGTTLDQMTSSDDFHLVSWQNALGLGGVVLAALVPVLLRRLWSKDLDDAAKMNDDDDDDDNDNVVRRTPSSSTAARPTAIARSKDTSTTDSPFRIDDLERGSL